MKGRGFNDSESICGLESKFRRKFSVAEDGELEKLEGGGGRRRRSCQIGGGRRRAYRNTSRFLISPCRAYVSEEAEDYVVKMSGIYRVFERHSDLYGQGNADKREGSGLWNWGTVDNQGPKRCRKTNSAGLCESIEERALWIFEEDDDDSNQIDENESEDQEMTLDEYERVLKEKKQAVQAVLLELAAGRNKDVAEGNSDDDEFEIVDATAIGDL